MELAYLVSIETSGWLFRSKEECCRFLNAAGLKLGLMQGWIGGGLPGSLLVHPYNKYYTFPHLQQACFIFPQEHLPVPHSKLE